MKTIKDKFSKQAATYKKYRPHYPAALYQYLLSLDNQKISCWDCGTGNGQVASELSKHFQIVYATDISQRQLDHAKPAPNIIYQNQRAETTDFQDNQFDLITVGQAVHWFDFENFNREVKRVGKAGGHICIWGYGLLKINPQIDPLIQHFYEAIIGPFWNQERRHVDQAYQTVTFDFKELETPKDIAIQVEWTIDELSGYFNSWSGVQNYLEKHPGSNPVEEVISTIKKVWKPNEAKIIRFPIFIRTGRIDN